LENFSANACQPTTNAAIDSQFRLGVPRLARELITTSANVSSPKNKKNAPAGESGNQRPKRTRGKLIRLDDLIPKEDVTGGHHMLFGATHISQTTNNPAKDN
jgi:hypothetical protein